MIALFLISYFLCFRVSLAFLELVGMIYFTWYDGESHQVKMETNKLRKRNQEEELI